jgi:putative ABC transport system permease protein
VRITLGASASHIVSAAAAQTLRLGIVGGSLGVLGALTLGRVMAASLYQTRTLDAAVLGGSVAVLIAAAFIATFVPSRSALDVNPLDVLRNERGARDGPRLGAIRRVSREFFTLSGPARVSCIC